MNIHRFVISGIACGLLWFAPTVKSQPSKRTLTAADLEYVGAMRVPLEATGFGKYGLTHRYVDGELHFIVSGHRHHNDPVLEFDAPGFAPNWEDAPRASLVQWWGDIYDGRKIVTDPGWLTWTEDLEWFNERLYWAYGHPYDLAHHHDPSIGYTELGGAAFGPWLTTVTPKLTRGYVTTIPEWYADAYTGGRRLAVGSGLRSGHILSSFGPNLHAIPDPSTISPDTALWELPLVQYSFWDRLDREDNYIPHYEFDSPGGIWTQVDFIESAVWVDTPEVHGVIFSGGLSAGNSWYGPNPQPDEGWYDECNGDQIGPHAEAYLKRWWIYDPMSFVPVAGGEPHAVRPSSVIDPNAEIPGTQIGYACLGAATGATFDPWTRMLYMIYPETEGMGWENLPVIYAFRVPE